MISSTEIDDQRDLADPVAPEAEAPASPFEGWPAAEALESLPASVQGALVSLKEDVAALRALATALPLRVKRVAQIKLLRKKVAARRLATLAAVAAFAAVIACVVVSLAAGMALFGAAAGLAALLELPLWAGLGLTGFGLLMALALTVLVGWRRYAAAQVMATRKALVDMGVTQVPDPASSDSTHQP